MAEKVKEKRSMKNDQKNDIRLSCDFCEKTYMYQSRLVKHQQLVHNKTAQEKACLVLPKQPNKCPVCLKSFASSTTLKIHISMHTGEKLYRCQFCTEDFRIAQNLSYHIRTLHSDVLHKCKNCPAELTTSKKLVAHEKRCSKTKVTSKEVTNDKECGICKKVFHARIRLQKHIARVHPKETNNTSQSTNTCSICFKIFRSRESLEDHFRIHTGEKPYKCKICDETFRSRHSRKAHNLRVHSSNKKVIKCKDCPATFFYKSHLLGQERVHRKPDEAKAFQCTNCEKSFSDKRDLLSHLDRHVDGKPDLVKFKCLVCLKEYTSRRTLKYHELLHKPSARNHKCSFCPKKYTRYDELVKHLRSHLGEKPYCCPQCGAGFSEVRYLRIHEGKCKKSMKTS